MESTKALGVMVEFIYATAPEQRGRVESFHETLKEPLRKEYLWPRDFHTFQEVEAAVAKASVDYN
ncbi:MAG: transposase [Nitrososphaerota archaeon]|nr:transposase [Nitrososphaerota archaeon]MDG6951540.1 transposase [Nitrososphaerota archaeon]MDG6990932.1 transposase [Nitrososphaerota archaeon]